MSDLVGDTKDRFSRIAAHFIHVKRRVLSYICPEEAVVWYNIDCSLGVHLYLLSPVFLRAQGELGGIIVPLPILTGLENIVVTIYIIIQFLYVIQIMQERCCAVYANMMHNYLVVICISHLACQFMVDNKMNI